MKISILHISDLHRDPNHPISNDALLNSLVRDIQGSTSEDPPIPLPQIIIVSGDIIQGTGKDTTDADGVLSAQYDQAEDFLGRLADEFVGGDRNRVVIVAGNHDVSFPATFSSLETVDYMKVDPKERWELAELLQAHDSPYRWSWSDFTLHKIHDDGVYSGRLKHFIAFYDRFYRGRRRYSEVPAEQFDLFDFPNKNLVIAGFNSCYMNDPLNKQGAIHPDSIARACSVLRGRKYRGRIRLAAWHHSIKGGPRQVDYLDTDFLQHLIANGFSLGFHGHQHKAEFIDEQYAFGGDRKVNVVSASTLCGGERALRAGTARGYNRLVIDNDTLTVELHVRQMANSDFKNPIWCKGSLHEYGSMIEFSMQKPQKADPSTYLNEDLRDAEAHLRAKRYSDAATLLEPLIADSDIARLFLLQAFIDGKDNAGIVRCFPNPVTAAEIIASASALFDEGRKDSLRQLLDSPEVENHEDPSVIHIRKKMMGRLAT